MTATSPTQGRGATKELQRMNPAQLAELHRRGTCPDPSVLRGVLDGAVLGTTVPRWAQPWRGKVAHRTQRGTVAGVNRLALGPLELRRYTFTVTRGTSAFDPRDVVLLDHDSSDNPAWIRRFHDELVQTESGVLLATTHYRIGGRLKPLGFFTLTPR